MNLSVESVRRRKFIIMILGISLSFFTSMNKMLVPGPIYNHLQVELLFDPARIAALGATFMYAYSVSQLLMGIYSARYGGVRILLIGGAMFTFGVMGFPLCSNPWLMYFFRALAGFGAGTVFIGLAKLVNDLFPEKFGLVLGIALLFGYFGPVTGTVPMVRLIAAIGWRKALFLPGAICFCSMLGIVCVMRGTLKKPVPGQTLAPFWTMLKNRPMMILCLSSALVFGVYYVLLTQVGQKCIEDFYHWGKYAASLCIGLLSVMVAMNNVAVNLFLRLSGGRHKPVYIAGTALLVLGCLTGFAAFRWQLPAGWLLTSFFLIGVPAGFFSFYSQIAKELNPPEATGLAVAVLNFSAFVFIALFGNLSGLVLSFWKEEVLQNGVFPGDAYACLFIVLASGALVSLATGILIPETGRKKHPAA
ncbi:MAG: MFS transporter [Lentisphaeria bacterium]|nr:MFS transporter [Lentisphaeria bacterium]